MKENKFKIVFLDTDVEWFSSSYFNGNAFPEAAKYSANSCWRRFSLIIGYYKNMPKQMERDLKSFLNSVNKNATNLNVGNNDLILEISYESMAYVTYLYGIIFMLKSFLDIWARTCMKTIDPKAKLRGFSKKNIDGRELSGGSFINWLKESAPTSSSIEQLADITKVQSEEWITQIVDYRDKLMHNGEIKELKPMRILAKAHTHAGYKEKDVFPPLMPDSTPVLDYCKGIMLKLNIYIINCLKLLPNIEIKYLSLKPFEFDGYFVHFPKQ